MSSEGVVFLLMILNVDAYVDVILERSLRSNGGHIGVNESLFTMVREMWTRMNVCFL